MKAYVEIAGPTVVDASGIPRVSQRFSRPVIEPNLHNDMHQHSGRPEGGSFGRTSERIEHARSAFVTRAYTKIERATELTTVLKSSDPSNAQAALGELHIIAHSLSGTAGSFGYNKVSELAALLEDLILSGQYQYRKISLLVVEIAVELVNYIAERKSVCAR